MTTSFSQEDTIASSDSSGLKKLTNLLNSTAYRKKKILNRFILRFGTTETWKQLKGSWEAISFSEDEVYLQRVKIFCGYIFIKYLENKIENVSPVYITCSTKPVFSGKNIPSHQCQQHHLSRHPSLKGKDHHHHSFHHLRQENNPWWHVMEALMLRLHSKKYH